MEGGVVMDFSDALMDAIGQWDAETALALEVSPGVTLSDAVRAYLALERIGNGWYMRQPDAWACGQAESFIGGSGPTLAAAILAAAEVPDA
jgi:hypothetical protein